MFLYFQNPQEKLSIKNLKHLEKNISEMRSIRVAWKGYKGYKEWDGLVWDSQRYVLHWKLKGK